MPYSNQTAHSSVQNRQHSTAATSSSNPDTQSRGRGSGSSFQTPSTGYSTAHQVVDNYYFF